METGQQTTKTFIWSMFGADFIETFERFNKLALVRGVHVSNLLTDLVQHYVALRDIKGTLVSEIELLKELQKRDISVSRVTLRNYRLSRKLVWNNHPVFFTDGRNVCYHLEHCIEFFEDRKGRRKYSSVGSSYSIPNTVENSS